MGSLLVDGLFFVGGVVTAVLIPKVFNWTAATIAKVKTKV